MNFSFHYKQICVCVFLKKEAMKERLKHVWKRKEVRRDKKNQGYERDIKISEKKKAGRIKNRGGKYNGRILR